MSPVLVLAPEHLEALGLGPEHEVVREDGIVVLEHGRDLALALAFRIQQDRMQVQVLGLGVKILEGTDSVAAGDGADRHRGAVLLALVGVAGDVGRSNVALDEETLVHIRFVAPGVDDEGAQFRAGPEERGLIDNLAARRIDEDSARLDLREELVVAHPARGVVQRDMDGHDLGLREEFVQCVKSFGAFPFSPGRVAAQDLETQLPAGALDFLAHVPDSYDPELGVLQRNLLPRRHPVQGGKNVVHHAACVASGRIVHLDPVLRTPGQVDMVGTDGGGRDHLHRRALQQVRIATRPGPGNQHVGIQAVLPADLPPVLVDHLGVRFENPLQEGNVRISDNLHDLSSSILQI